MTSHSGGLLARIRPDLIPARPLPPRVERPVERDTRPQWLRRRDEGLLRAKELVA